MMRRVPGLSEVCLDLLKRMLEFDPESRCSATEALSHEYFEEMTRNHQDIHGEISVAHSRDKETFKRFEIDLDNLLKERAQQDTAGLKEILEMEIEEHHRMLREDGGKDRWKPLETNEIGLNRTLPVSTACLDSEGAVRPEIGKEERIISPWDNLGPERHKDWTSTTSCSDVPHWSKPAEPVWGVSTVIPGMENKESKSIVSHQQSR